MMKTFNDSLPPSQTYLLTRSRARSLHGDDDRVLHEQGHVSYSITFRGIQYNTRFT